MHALDIWKILIKTEITNYPVVCCLKKFFIAFKTFLQDFISLRGGSTCYNWLIISILSGNDDHIS